MHYYIEIYSYLHPCMMTVSQNFSQRRGNELFLSAAPGIRSVYIPSTRTNGDKAND
jgi:hypothetical protein